MSDAVMRTKSDDQTSRAGTMQQYIPYNSSNYQVFPKHAKKDAHRQDPLQILFNPQKPPPKISLKHAPKR
jgi:hypothetical protein